MSVIERSGSRASHRRPGPRGRWDGKSVIGKSVSERSVMIGKSVVERSVMMNVIETSVMRQPVRRLDQRGHAREPRGDGEREPRGGGREPRRGGDGHVLTVRCTEWIGVGNGTTKGREHGVEKRPTQRKGRADGVEKRPTQRNTENAQTRPHSEKSLDSVRGGNDNAASKV
jgi:hypothetical protein